MKFTLKDSKTKLIIKLIKDVMTPIAKTLLVALPVAALVVLGFQNCSSSSGGSPAAAAGTPDTTQSVCPSNFVPVAGNSTFNTTDFCISKYEAKQVNGLPESLAADTPWVDITRDQAKAACTAKGTGYSLVDNNHWMTIARDIEATAWNYGGDPSIFEDGWSRGVTNNSGPTGVPASTDDNNSCYLATEKNGTLDTCDLNTYNTARRVAKLSNGSLMWDFAGNASEWISDDFTTNYGPNGWVLNLTDPTVKNLFGPSGTYPVGPASPTGNIFMQNFGYLSADTVNADHTQSYLPPYVVHRGGGFSYGRYAGIYTAYFVPPSQTGADIGFRCMFQP